MATITKSKYFEMLQATGEVVGQSVREVVPDRRIIVPGMATGPQMISHADLTNACAATAGVVLGQMFDVLGIQIVDDPPEVVQ